MGWRMEGCDNRARLEERKVEVGRKGSTEIESWSVTREGTNKKTFRKVKKERHGHNNGGCAQATVAGSDRIAKVAASKSGQALHVQK